MKYLYIWYRFRLVMLMFDLHKCQTSTDNAHSTTFTHQRHKAHANADIPHFDSFVSGARQKKRSRFPTLLSLKSKQVDEPKTQ